MSRLEIMTENRVQQAIDKLYQDLERRLSSGPTGLCPVDTALNIVTLCQSQSCGKCVPCRVGLGVLADLLKDVLDGKADSKTISTIEKTATGIIESADCAIGYDSARMLLDSLIAFKDDFTEHIEKGRCLSGTDAPVPCVRYCPSHVDIPGYIALANKGQYADALRLMWKDNPFPITCGYICEHPCENHCRRGMLDSAINIRGIKQFITENAGVIPPLAKAAPTGKKVAVIGGGPGGLSAAYFLSLMGHEVTVYERRKKLGGMLRYGIPAYRFPRELLDRDINNILATGITVKLETDIGTDISIDEIMNTYDSLFVAIGAHTDSKARIEGEDLEGVTSAVDLLRTIGDEEYPDYTGKTVVVVGGGNVAMDATRTSLRLGAKKVYCVYRRRQTDMTALPDEIEGAIAEGAELLTLKAPVRIEADENGRAVALWTQPQLPGELDSGGRPAPMNADLPEERIAADIFIMAVGQRVESDIFEKADFPLEWGNLKTLPSGEVFQDGKVFAGGDCATGPASAIQAVAAGKVAAANIDNYLGFNNVISTDVEIPPAQFENKNRRGRVNVTEREASERRNDFEYIECPMTKEGAEMETSRCLRCDRYGYGSFRGGRNTQW
ncbi:MAG: NAD(P)-binding protein [Oscillospiraceae bacterium]|nr:NAD(P)-binding protein [Oscillospiraceae bacterium]